MAGHMGYGPILLARPLSGCVLMVRFPTGGSAEIVNQPAIPEVPLLSLPLIPFDFIGMDLIGPLHHCACRYHFVLVLVDLCVVIRVTTQ